MRRLLREILASVCAGSPLRRVICWRGPRNRRAVALTFDDGPRGESTLAILAILRGAGVRATFFLEGRWIEKDPALVARIAAEGHEIGNHAYEHGAGGLRAQVERCTRLMSEQGLRTRWFRPPLGRLGVGDLLWLARRGHRTVLWSFDTHDSMRHEGKWNGAPPDYAAIRPGDIILMHDDNPVCRAELPLVLEQLARRNIGCVTLSGLLAVAGNEHDYRQDPPRHR